MASSLRKHKKLSDEEFIEAVRADLAQRRNRARRQKVLGLVLLAAGGACMMLLPVWLMSYLWGLGPEALQLAMMGGLSMGAAGATFVLLAVRLLQEARMDSPTDRMARLLTEGPFSESRLSLDRTEPNP